MSEFETDSFEADLRQLRPRRPSDRLENLIENALSEPPAPVAPQVRFPRLRPTLWFAGLGIAAGAAVLLGWFNWNRPPDEFRPVSIENFVYSQEEPEIVRLEDGSVAQLIRIFSMDTITWANPRTKATLVVREPRDEIHLQPIAYN